MTTATERLQTALGLVLQEFKAKDPAEYRLSGNHGKIKAVKNQTMFQITDALMSNQSDEDHAAGVKLFQETVRSLFQDPNIPLDVAYGVSLDLDYRFRAKRSIHFFNFMKQNHIHLIDTIDAERRVAAPRPSPPLPATSSSSSSSGGVDSTTTVPAVGSDGQPRGKYGFKPHKQFVFPKAGGGQYLNPGLYYRGMGRDRMRMAAAGGDGSTSVPSLSEVRRFAPFSGAPEDDVASMISLESVDLIEVDGQESTTTVGGAGSGEKKRMTKKEQLFQVSALVETALHKTKAGEEIAIENLFSDAATAGLIRNVRPEFKGAQKKKFLRLVHECTEVLESKYALACGQETLVNLTALRREREPVQPVFSDNFDRGFRLCLHLLLKHFHIKRKGASTKEYPGHNICVVLFDPEGHIVGYDFNQCKFDKNLCSHAEKRMAEALTRILALSTPEGKPPNLEGYSFMSSLEPCHMCANFISRMGIKQIGYLMKDPMQLDALDYAAKTLNLEVYRPKETMWSDTVENVFKNSKFPEDEITDWLGDEECKLTLQKLCEQYPLPVDSEDSLFFEASTNHYPGYIALRSSLEENEEEEGLNAANRQPTSELLNLGGPEGNDGDDDEQGEDRNDDDGDIV